MKKFLFLILVAVGLTGCSNSSNAITLSEAETIALNEVGGEIIRSSQESDDGRIVYDVDVLSDGTLHEFEINAKGKITSHEQERNYATNYTTTSSSNNSSNNSTDTNNSSNTTTNATQTADIITAEEANTIALNRVGGGNVTKNELDTDDGVVVYEIEIVFNVSEYELVINAVTGAIISFDHDSVF